LWETYNKHYGKDGDDILVWQSDTRSMNPSVPQSFIDRHMAEDPARASAEYGAQFRNDLEALFVREAVSASTSWGVRERAPQLQVRYREVRDQEQAKAWLAEYDVMKRKRDGLAEELCEVYADTVNKVVDLFVRITADEKELSALHQARPRGVMEHLVSAELHARGLARFTRDVPSLLTSVCLFDWNSGRQI
jgi:hypothetical protein